jgi:hypothetical protein
MPQRATLFLLLLRSAASGFAQVDSSAVPTSHFLKHALFVCPDTSYRMSYVLAEEFNGLTFYRQWLEPQDFRWESLARIPESSELTSRTETYNTTLEHGVDTLRSMFTTSVYAPPEAGEEGAVRYFEDEQAEDAFLSFAMRDFGLLDLDSSTAYFFGQAENSAKREGKRYVLCEVLGWRGATPKFRYTVGLLALEGFVIIDRAILPVTRKEFNRLRRKLIFFSDRTWESCVSSNQGTSDLLVVGGKRVVIAEHCREVSKWRQRPEAMVGIYWHYWKHCRSRSPSNLPIGK